MQERSRQTGQDGNDLPPTVLVVGSMMIDLVTHVDRMPQAGETLAGGPFELGFGGKGANQAVMAHLLGAEVSLAGRVGDDLFGEQTVAHLDGIGVDVRHVQSTVEEVTGAASILVEPSGENRIVIAPGANRRTSVDDVERVFGAVAAPDVVLCQLEIDQEPVRRALELGRACGAMTILNPAPAAALDPGTPSVVDWLVPNEPELQMLAAASGFEGHRTEELAARLAAQWHLGVVVTLGELGAYVISPDSAQPSAAVPSPDVEVADTVGAGDAFVAAFAVALAAGRAPVEAATIGCRCAADAVTRPGTQASFLVSPILDELRAALHRGTSA